MRSSQPRLSRQRRAAIGEFVSFAHHGVAHRADLRREGVGYADIRSEVAAGRWLKAGRHTVVIGTGPLTPDAALWWAVWESGSGAVLDGAAALVASGLKGFTAKLVDVSLPHANRPRPAKVKHAKDKPAQCKPAKAKSATSRVRGLPAVKVQRRRTMVDRADGEGPPRVRTNWATIHAAQWAVSDRQAALLVCLAVQQRLVAPAQLLTSWSTVRKGPRHDVLDHIIRDVCDGAHSLGELDFAGLCRARGLPEPTRQRVVRLADGRIYLDVAWDDVGLVVEIDGGHHAMALNPVDDALRQNTVVLRGRMVLRIPVLGLRLMPDAFIDQVVEGHAALVAAA